MLPLHSPHGKAPHLHASQFSSSEIFYEITSAFLKTGINLRNLSPAHSRGAVTFSGLCCILRSMIDLGLQTGMLNKVNALFDIKKTLQNGHFRSFAEKARGLDPQDPSNWAPTL